MNTHVIGVDVGGTNIRVALLNDKLKLIKKETVLTSEFQKAEDFFLQIKKMIRRVDPDHLAKAVGIVLPAPWTSKKMMITDSTNVPYLENLPVENIKKAFSEYEIFLENDVNVIALLESDYGAARSSKHSVYITISTGIGSGVIINNQIYHGANGYAGEMGSIIISDKDCTKENPLQGSLEEVCSGKALEQKSIALYGNHATARQLFLHYEEGEQKAVEIVNEWFDHLTRGLAAVIQMMDPDIVVLGGPVVLNHKWIIQRIKVEISKKVLGQLAAKTKIVAAEFGIEAGIIGAGYYALQKTEGERK